MRLGFIWTQRSIRVDPGEGSNSNRGGFPVEDPDPSAVNLVGSILLYRVEDPL